MSIGTFDQALDVIVRCRDGELDRSLIRAGLDSGEDGILRKLGEEASDLVLACKDHKYGDGPKETVEEECGDI